VKPQRIGVLGGTFDPIHYGHLAIAVEARWVPQLEQVLFVVAAQQLLKLGGHATTAQQRLEMVRLACASEPAFLPSDIELRRAPPCYTVDTLNELRATLPTPHELFFIIGGDTLADLPRWYAAARLIGLAQLAVVERPGSREDPAALAERLPSLESVLCVSRGRSLRSPAVDCGSAMPPIALFATRHPMR